MTCIQENEKQNKTKQESKVQPTSKTTLNTILASLTETADDIY